jgi:toxin-antitoxin system PIN domain toxin
VIALDTNLLVYAHREESPWHEVAFEAVRTLAEGRSPWAIPWPCLHEFVAITTHPRIYDPPTSTPAALAQVEAWLLSPSLVLLTEGPRYWQVFRHVVTDAGVHGPQVHDARVAALCLHHGVRELWSADRDFARFAALAVRNPLLTSPASS